MIADFRHRVTLEERVSVADGGGGATESWNEVATLWAAIDQKSGQEQERADRSIPLTRTEITMRYRDGVSTDMRFRQGSKTFNIRAVLDLDGRRRWLKCTCEEGGAS